MSPISEKTKKTIEETQKMSQIHRNPLRNNKDPTNLENLRETTKQNPKNNYFRTYSAQSPIVWKACFSCFVRFSWRFSRVVELWFSLGFLEFLPTTLQKPRENQNTPTTTFPDLFSSEPHSMESLCFLVLLFGFPKSFLGLSSFLGFLKGF